MRVEKNFNLRSAPLIEVVSAEVSTPAGHALGIKVLFKPTYLQEGFGTLAAGFTPDEARDLGERLIRAANDYDLAQ